MPSNKSSVPTKSKRIIFRLSIIEFLALSNAAQQAGVTMSEWLLSLACGDCMPLLQDPLEGLERAREALGEAYFQLTRFTNNLNQIACKQLQVLPSAPSAEEAFGLIESALDSARRAAGACLSVSSSLVDKAETMEGDKDETFTFRALPEEKELIWSRAKLHNLSVSGYLRGLVRTHSEYEKGYSYVLLQLKVGDVNRDLPELLAAGKELNALAHDINLGAKTTDDEAPQLIAAQIMGAAALYRRIDTISNSAERAAGAILEEVCGKCLSQRQ